MFSYPSHNQLPLHAYYQHPKSFLFLKFEWQNDCAASANYSQVRIGYGAFIATPVSIIHGNLKQTSSKSE